MGCDGPTSGSALKPEGAPEVLQVFVADETGHLDTYIQNNPGLDDTDGNGCPDVFEEAAVDCAVSDALPLGGRVRVIVDELLDGSTVEAFVCACYTDTENDPTGTPDDDCGAGPRVSITGNDCPNNTEADSPGDDSGRWLDANADGVPDLAEMLPNVISVVCNSGDNGADEVKATTGGGAGFYNPSGNQQVPIEGTGKIGPALVLDLPELTTGSTCRVVIPADSPARDKDGNAIPAIDATKTFTVAPFHVLGASPADEATGVELDSELVFSLNASIDPATLAGVTLKTAAGVDVPGVAAVDGTDIVFTPAAPLAPLTEYVFSIAATVLAVEDAKPVAPFMVTFTTGEPPAEM
jgi:hypothetical protein